MDNTEILHWSDMKHVFSKDLMDALCHNKPPTEGTLRTIAAIRRDPQPLVTASIERRKCIDRDIKQLIDERDRLADTVKVCATIRSACDAISSPIRGLPLDIIREIAFFALEEHPSASLKSSLMTLTRVCSVWRTVVLSSPLLWSTLYVKIDNLNQDSIVKYVGTVQNWFQRALGAPKRFFLYVACPIATGTPSYHLRLFLKAIGPSLSGLSCLGIGSDNWANLMMQFVDIAWDVSNLQRVEVLGQLMHGDNDYLERGMAKLALVADRIILFKNSDRLAKIVAVQELRPFTLISTFFPWHQITDLSLEESNHTRVCTIETLRNSPQLQSLRLFCANLRHQEGTAPLIHRNLERLVLRISKSNACDLLAFLAKCTFPNLKETRFIGVKHVQETQNSPQISAINTLPSLEVLHLSKDIRLPTCHLLSLFHGTPKLRVLSMKVADGDGHSLDLDDVFTSMTVEGRHCKMLPRLEQCIFYGVSSNPATKFFLDASLVSRFIDSRLNDLPEGCSRLKDIRLLGCFDFLTDVQAEVRHLSQGKNQISILVIGGTEEDMFVYDPSKALHFKMPFTLPYIKLIDHKIRLSEPA